MQHAWIDATSFAPMWGTEQHPCIGANALRLALAVALAWECTWRADSAPAESDWYRGDSGRREGKKEAVLDEGWVGTGWTSSCASLEGGGVRRQLLSHIQGSIGRPCSIQYSKRRCEESHGLARDSLGSRG